MMVYGITKLNDMEESHLDRMDPYQRNANNIRECRLLSLNDSLILVKHKHPRITMPLDDSDNKFTSIASLDEL